MAIKWSLGHSKQNSEFHKGKKVSVSSRPEESRLRFQSPCDTARGLPALSQVQLQHGQKVVHRLMEIMIFLNEKEEDAITKKDREVEKKEGCGNAVMSCLQVWKTSQEEGIEAAVGPHVRFLQGNLENQDPHCPAYV